MKWFPAVWGGEEVMEGDGYLGKILLIVSGASIPPVHHKHRLKTLYCLEGEVKVSYYDPSELYLVERAPKIFHLHAKYRWLHPGDQILILPNSVHSIKAVGTSRVLELGTPDFDDVHQLKE